MGWFKKDPLQIIAFQGYGTNSHFYARGRALEDESINLDQQNLWQVMLNTWKRFETDEVKHVAIHITLPDATVLKGKTDNHGYYRIEANLQNLAALSNEEGWLSFELSYDDAVIKNYIQNNNKFAGKILIPASNAAYGVISDIDDTILHTGVISKLKWRVIVNSFFKHATARIPLEGAAYFYHKLHKGALGTDTNPIFYVSHSPWNLYRYLELFLRQNDFPNGPILLRSMKHIFRKKSVDTQPQKQKEIYNLLKTYPNLPFILIGDSGEHDPDIYMEIASAFPDRILAIYLRSVKHKKKMLRVRSLLEHFKTTEVVMAETSAQAIEHAKQHGFIA
ncbi:phosphatase domain-containing protein [uncultured Winogradskyella sp.]|uniref:App1 family protein n=1 Tax=uncultured Winogradskyella sp. TaxID=395353 RepID=UPI002610A170|nr:phosphatase domain-containing protein [uncultured Winogradskyella sp.]